MTKVTGEVQSRSWGDVFRIFGWKKDRSFSDWADSWVLGSDNWYEGVDDSFNSLKRVFPIIDRIIERFNAKPVKNTLLEKEISSIAENSSYTKLFMRTVCGWKQGRTVSEWGKSWKFRSDEWNDGWGDYQKSSKALYAKTSNGISEFFDYWSSKKAKVDEVVSDKKTKVYDAKNEKTSNPLPNNANSSPKMTEVGSPGEEEMPRYHFGNKEMESFSKENDQETSKASILSNPYNWLNCLEGSVEKEMHNHSDDDDDEMKSCSGEDSCYASEGIEEDYSSDHGKTHSHNLNAQETSEVSIVENPYSALLGKSEKRRRHNHNTPGLPCFDSLSCFNEQTYARLCATQKNGSSSKDENKDLIDYNETLFTPIRRGSSNDLALLESFEGDLQGDLLSSSSAKLKKAVNSNQSTFSGPVSEVDDLCDSRPFEISLNVQSTNEHSLIESLPQGENFPFLQSQNPQERSPTPENVTARKRKSNRASSLLKPEVGFLNLSAAEVVTTKVDDSHLDLLLKEYNQNTREEEKVEE
jgi:hypothetical protein